MCPPSCVFITIHSLQKLPNHYHLSVMYRLVKLALPSISNNLTVFATSLTTFDFWPMSLFKFPHNNHIIYQQPPHGAKNAVLSISMRLLDIQKRCIMPFFSVSFLCNFITGQSHIFDHGRSVISSKYDPTFIIFAMEFFLIFVLNAPYF